MNIQKIFNALEDDEMNSAIGTIVNELEQQGYKVRIDDAEASAEEIFDGSQEELNLLSTLKIDLFKDNLNEQSFIIEFTDYHDFIIKKYTEDKS